MTETTGTPAVETIKTAIEDILKTKSANAKLSRAVSAYMNAGKRLSKSASCSASLANVSANLKKPS